MRIPLLSRLEIVLFGLMIFAGLVIFPAAAAIPSFYSMTPQIGMQGSNVPITITGSNIEPGAWVSFEHYPTWDYFMYINSPKVSPDGTTLTGTLSISQGAPSGYWDVFVHNPGNMNAGHEGWFVTGALTPSVTNIDPPAACQGCDSWTIMDGTNFVYGATMIFSGHTGSVPYASNVFSSSYGTQLYSTINVPSDAATGPWTITIQNPNGGSVNLINAYTVTVPPVITSMTPNSGTQGETVPFTITGSGFQSDAGVYVWYECGEYGLDVSGFSISTDGTTATGTITIPADAPTECAYNAEVSNPSETGGGRAEVPFTVTASGLGSCAAVILDTTTTLNAANGALDLDTGAIGVSYDADVVWTEVTSMDLVPENGAKIVNLGLLDFDAITIDDLVGYSYGDDQIADNELVDGDVFAVQTNLGNFTKVQVNFQEGSALGLHLVTYSVSACKEDAYDHLKSELPGGDMPPDASLYVSDKPVSGDVNQLGASRACSTGCNAWLYLFDPTPGKNWEHDVTWYFSCLSDPTVIHTCEAFTPPENIKIRWFKGLKPPRSGTTGLLTRSGINSVGADGARGGLLFDGVSASGTCDSSQQNCENCYALLVSGGYDPDNNNERYYQDMSAMYKTLKDSPYCYPENQIYVLMSDGTVDTPDKITDAGPIINSDPDLDNDGLPEEHYAAATRANLDSTLALLRNLGQDAHLFVFTTNHGGLDPSTGKVRLWLWNNEFIGVDAFVSELPTQTKALVMTMEQCNGGGFVDPVIAGYTPPQSRVIATAASATEPSNMNYFSFYWIKGLGGLANSDSDSLVEMREDFDYAKKNDPSAQPGTPTNLRETPQYGDTPSNTGLTMALSSCSKCAEPRLLPDCPTCQGPPTDVAPKDGIYEDLNGDGSFNRADVILYFNRMETLSTSEPICAFDTNANGRIDFADVVNLFIKGGF